MITAKQMENLSRASVSVDAEKAKVRVAETFKEATKQQKDEITGLSGLSMNTFYNVGKTGSASPKVVLALAQIMKVSPFYLTGESDSKELDSEATINEFFKKHKEKTTAKSTTKSTKANKKAVKTNAVVAPETNAVKKEEPQKQASKQRTTSKQKLAASKPKPANIKKPQTNTKSEKSTKPVSDDLKTPDKEQPQRNIADNSTASTVLNKSEYRINLNNTDKMNSAIAALDTEAAKVLLEALIQRAEAGGEAEVLCDIVKRCLLS